MGLFLILLLRQGLLSKFSDLAFRYSIRLMGLFSKIEILTFFEEPPLITGWTLQKGTSERCIYMEGENSNP